MTPRTLSTPCAVDGTPGRWGRTGWRCSTCDRRAIRWSLITFVLVLLFGALAHAQPLAVPSVEYRAARKDTLVATALAAMRDLVEAEIAAPDPVTPAELLAADTRCDAFVDLADVVMDHLGSTVFHLDSWQTAIDRRRKELGMAAAARRVEVGPRDTRVWAVEVR